MLHIYHLYLLATFFMSASEAPAAAGAYAVVVHLLNLVHGPLAVYSADFY
jgi:hypothetical protein